MKVPFYKCNSKGNSFIILYPFPISPRFLAKLPPDKIINICNSIDNQKVDGLILLNNIDGRYDREEGDLRSSFTGRAQMIYYNNDGSCETFCLNGVICCSLIINPIINPSTEHYTYTIKTGSGLYGIQIMKDDLVLVELPMPINMKFEKSVGWQKESSGASPLTMLLIDDLECYYINSGANHIIIKSKDDKLFDDDLKLKKILKKIRYNKLFLPDGVNVNIYRCKGPNAIQVKTYEKGIEGMMSSCSSGSYACAYHYYHCYEKSPRIKILNDGGTSEIVFKENGKNLFLSKGEIEYKGELDI